MYKDKEQKIKHLSREKERYLKSVYTFTPQVLNSNKSDKYLSNKADFLQRSKE